ncbi:MAG: hypothetical protein ACE5JZ_10840 [Kiloniellales bacterium]
MARFVELRRLLDAVAAVEDRLAPHERELYRDLKAKYAEPVQTAADDRTCLEVMLRNVEIRKSYGLDSGRASNRVIEVKRRRGP